MREGRHTTTEVSLSYVVGVDLGTTFSAAAVGRNDRVEIFDLGTRSAAIPSVVLLRADGTVLVGEAAERRSVTEASRTAREFKRRLGDPTPFLLGGTPYGAESLTGHLLGEIVRRIAEQMGEPPAQVILTHPANYGDYKLGYLEEAARLAGVGSVEFVPEPVAAAVHYATSERLAVGELLGVYDFGGGTLDIAALRVVADGFEIVGTPEGMDRFGGIDLDEAVFFHVRESLGEAMAGLDPADPASTAALAALRGACTDAKEGLSADTDTTIPVMLPAVHTEVRLTRSEFEDMLRPRLRETMAVLERVLASAGASYDDVSRILLVGGASRIPLVAEMIRQETGRPVAVDANPKYAVSMGAARVALVEPGSTATPDLPGPDAGEEEADASPALEPSPPEPAPEPSSPAPDDPPPAEDAPPPTVDEDSSPELETGDEPRRWGRWIAAVLALIAVGLVAAFATGLLGGEDEPVAQEPSIDDTLPVPAEEPIPEEPGSDDSLPVVGDDLPPVPMGLVYYTQFRDPDHDGDWGPWAVGEATPPGDIAADYYPELGPYSSNDAGVRDQHLAWIEGTGADLLVINWSGPEFGDRGLLEAILEDALQSGLTVATVIEPYEGRSPESVMADLEFLTGELGAHPAWFRSLRPAPWVDDAGRPVVLIASPELIEDRPELGPQDWIGVADYAHELGAVVLAVNTDPGWVEGGHFDGLVGGPVDGSYAWTGDLPEAAWFVPTVTPGRSLERLGEPEAGQERNEGAFFEEQWMLLATSSHSIDMVVVVSFNGWPEGTQIEPAAAEPPDPRYRTYAPLDPNTYLGLTRELSERVLSPRG